MAPRYSRRSRGNGGVARHESTARAPFRAAGDAPGARSDHRTGSGWSPLAATCTWYTHHAIRRRSREPRSNVPYSRSRDGEWRSWQRTCFGSTRSRVRVPPPRPAPTTCRSTDHEFVVDRVAVRSSMDGGPRLEQAVGPARRSRCSTQSTSEGGMTASTGRSSIAKVLPEADRRPEIAQACWKEAVEAFEVLERRSGRPRGWPAPRSRSPT